MGILNTVVLTLSCLGFVRTIDIFPEDWEVESLAVNLVSGSRDSFVNESNIAIAVMGATGTGKTSFINLVSGSDLRVGQGLKSCTNVVQMSEPFELDGQMVTLIDTPGFDDTTKSDTDILNMIAAFLAIAYENEEPLAGIIYLHRISDVRMGGISTRNFKMFRELCGDSTLGNVAVVTNMWGEVSREVGEAREEELASQDAFFKPVLEKGAKLLRHENTVESGQMILRHLIGNNPLPLLIQRELVDEGKHISDTAAGAELDRAVVEQMKKHREEIRILQEETEAAIKAKDEETKRELAAEREKLEAKIAGLRRDAQRQAAEFERTKAELISGIARRRRRCGFFCKVSRIFD